MSVVFCFLAHIQATWNLFWIHLKRKSVPKFTSWSLLPFSPVTSLNILVFWLPELSLTHFQQPREDITVHGCTENTGLLTLFSLGHLCSLLLAPCPMATAANLLFLYSVTAGAPVCYPPVWVALAQMGLGLLSQKTKMVFPSSLVNRHLHHCLLFLCFLFLWGLLN